MMRATLRGLLAVMLFSPFTAFPEAVTYYDCRNADGSMSYRIFPCSKSQKEVRKQTSAVARMPAHAVSAPAATPGSREDAQAGFEAANAAYLLDRYKDAAALYRKAAEQGHASAQYSLGSMYEKGEGVAQDYPQAASWYRKAAEHGNMKAQNSLGFMYSQGKGVEQNYATAHMWFNISGMQGYEEGRKNREFIEKLMTPAQIAEAQQQAGEWMKAHP